MSEKLEGKYYDDLRAKLVLIQAVLDGKVIEFCSQYNEKWSVINGPDFSCELHRYRIKPPAIERWVVVDVSNNVLYSCSLEYVANNYCSQCNEVSRVTKLMEVT